MDRAVSTRLSRFLGANSRIWNEARRQRLFEVLASTGAGAVGPVLAVVMACPRQDVIDDAVRVLAMIAPSTGGLFHLYAVRAEHPAIRVVSVRVLATVDHADAATTQAIVAALDDRAPEVRDAAVYALGARAAGTQLRDWTHPYRDLLNHRLQTERNPVVRESIEAVLAELAGV